MSLHHSEQTHAALLARVASSSGKDVKEWLQIVQDGPAFTRLDERVHWLQDEHELPHGYATAIAHEFDMARAARRVS
jgi:hypothetical protein